MRAAVAPNDTEAQPVRSSAQSDGLVLRWADRVGEQAVMDRVVILYCLKLWPERIIIHNICPVQNIRTPNKYD